jgi:hypothetical protein
MTGVALPEPWTPADRRNDDSSSATVDRHGGRAVHVGCGPLLVRRRDQSTECERSVDHRTEDHHTDNHRAVDHRTGRP